MKVFVTGATGFIGRHLVKRLLDEGHEVVCGGRSLSKLVTFADRAKLVYLDTEDKESVAVILSRERPQVLFHCAALIKSNCLKKLLRVNAEGTRNVLESCLSKGIGRVVYLSSVAVVSGNPQLPLTDDLPYKASNPYGESKIEAEKIAIDYRKRGLEVSIFRPCLVYGEDEPHFLSILVRLIKWRLMPILGEGNKRLHLVDVDNVVEAMMLALVDDRAYKGTFIVADKEVLTIGEILEYSADLLKAKLPFHIPNIVVSFLSNFPFLGRKFVSSLLKERVYSIERLRQDLDYVPRISAYDGLKRALTK